MAEFIEKTTGAIKETWVKSIDFLIKCGGEWLKPRTFFALMFYGAYIKLTLDKVVIPQGLELIVGSLLGFFFGSRINKNNGQVNGGQK